MFLLDTDTISLMQFGVRMPFPASSGPAIWGSSPEGGSKGERDAEPAILLKGRE